MELSGRWRRRPRQWCAVYFTEWPSWLTMRWGTATYNLKISSASGIGTLTFLEASLQKITHISRMNNLISGYETLLHKMAVICLMNFGSRCDSRSSVSDLDFPCVSCLYILQLCGLQHPVLVFNLRVAVTEGCEGRLGAENCCDCGGSGFDGPFRPPDQVGGNGRHRANTGQMATHLVYGQHGHSAGHWDDHVGSCRLLRYPVCPFFFVSLRPLSRPP